MGFPGVNVRVARPQVTLPPGTRLGTPSAMIFLLGLALIYFALHSWDVKYGTFNGAFAGRDVGSRNGNGDTGPNNSGGGGGDFSGSPGDNVA